MTLTTPRVLIEVLSPATEAVDRGQKLIRYVNLPTLAEYLLIAQHLVQVMSCRRESDGRWTLSPVVEHRQASAVFQSLDLEIPLRDIYADVSFV